MRYGRLYWDYASHCGWTVETVRAQDYWLIEERFQQLIAEDKLEALMDAVVTNGATGKQTETKYDGSPVSPPDTPPNIIKLDGLRDRQNELLVKSGRLPLEEPLTPAQQYFRMRQEIERRRGDGD